MLSIQSEIEFNDKCLKIFHYQYLHVAVYREWCNALNKNPDNVRHYLDIPFLPVEFFKSKNIIADGHAAEMTFSSSGTTGSLTSKHPVASLEVYKESFLKSFQLFYGQPEDYTILALLPSYLEREGSSLIYMVEELIRLSHKPESGFYLDQFDKLVNQLRISDERGKVLLIGVSFALLDLAERFTTPLNNTIIMETGGMKGRRKEMVREELHEVLSTSFGVNKIHSEYGMTELLSQAYSKGDGLFSTPPWMKVLIRDAKDPFAWVPAGKSGVINIIDLANIYSCSFLALSDVGKLHADGSFEVLGRTDFSDIRGCNLLIG